MCVHIICHAEALQSECNVVVVVVAVSVCIVLSMDICIFKVTYVPKLQDQVHYVVNYALEAHTNFPNIELLCMYCVLKS